MSAAQSRPRFPLPRYPTGWFQVLWSNELEPEQSIPATNFGQDLVIYRGASGEVSVLDAHCPHMGAHLGHGGRVEGDELVCPFHAWRFGHDGQCKGIPYAERVPKRASVKKWHAREVNGGIFVWHDIDNREPLWEMPDLEEFRSDEWGEALHRQWRIRTHNQEMAENMVDTAHFRYLHGTINMPGAEVVRRDHILEMTANTTMTTPGGEVPGFIQATAYGFGFSTNRFTGLVETLLIGAVVPVDEDYVDVRFSFVVKKFGGRSITSGVGKAFVAEISRQLEQDKPVWENKVYIDPPLLCDGDGPVGLFRAWCKQFYPDWYKAQAYEAFHGRPMHAAQASK